MKRRVPNENKKLSRRSFLKTSATAFVAGALLQSCAGIDFTQQLLNASLGYNKLDGTPYDEKFGIKIYGQDADERQIVKDALHFMHEMPSMLREMGIEYDEPINKLSAFKDAEIPIVIDKNLKKNDNGNACFTLSSEGNMLQIDSDYIKECGGHLLSVAIFHELEHFMQDKHNLLLPLDTAGYSAEEIKRQVIECELLANASEMEYDALALMTIPKSNNDARTIAKTFSKGDNGFKKSDSQGFLKLCASMAALKTIVKDGPEAVANMNTKTAAYNVIRGHTESDRTSPSSILKVYEKRAKKNGEDYIEETKRYPDSPHRKTLKENVELIYSLDSRGSMIGKIKHPLCDENNDLLDKVSKTNNEGDFFNRFFDRKTKARSG